MKNLLTNSLKKDGFIGTLKKVPSEFKSRSKLLYDRIIFYVLTQKSRDGFIQKTIQGSQMA